jgi:preprotein translocase subunit SecE
MSMNPAKYLREVRNEMHKVTWPTRRETLVSTGLVLALSTVAAIFFMMADSLIGWGVTKILGIGGM